MKKNWEMIIIAVMLIGGFSLLPAQRVQAAVNCDDPGVICKSGTLAGDETWTSENIYVIIGSDLIVPSGVTLTVEAGTIVKIDAYTLEIIVDGSLVITGQEGNPVYITSSRDDIGGDTNHDTTPPAAGNWGRVYFRGGSNGTLEHVEMRYGGNTGYGGGAMLYTDGGTSVSIDHGVFKYSQECAISSDPGYDPTLTNMAPTDFTDSAYNGLCMRGLGISVNSIWDETEAVYVLMNDATVTSGYTLTLGPGVVVKPRDYTVELLVDGTFNVNGTSTDPVYFSSVKDDSVGGQTNNNADPPAVGNWGRVYFRGGSSGNLQHVEMRYGGNAIYVQDAYPTITNCILRSNTRGLSSYGANGHSKINYCDIYANSEYGVYNRQSGQWLDATHNWWGSASGPYDPSPPGTDGQYNYGSGDKVNDYVQYDPWMGPVTTGISIYIPLVIR